MYWVEYYCMFEQHQYFFADTVKSSIEHTRMRHKHVDNVSLHTYLHRKVQRVLVIYVTHVYGARSGSQPIMILRDWYNTIFINIMKNTYIHQVHLKVPKMPSM